MNNALKVLTCGVAIIGLGGCQSFLADLGLAKRGVSDSSIAQEGSSRLELGRAALRAGAPGTAIHHFERAILDPAQAADAYNGMGVAYAKLGREDLAKRFFTAALMIRPKDERIARNLDRLNGSAIGNSARAYAAKEQEAHQIVAQAEADAIAQGMIESRESRIDDRGPVMIDARRGSLKRNSKREVIISAGEPRKPQEATRESISRKDEAPLPKAEKDMQPMPVTRTKISAAAPKLPVTFDYANIVCADGNDAPPAMEFPIRVSLKGDAPGIGGGH